MTTEQNPYLQLPGENINDYVKRIIGIKDQAVTPVVQPTFSQQTLQDNPYLQRPDEQNGQIMNYVNRIQGLNNPSTPPATPVTPVTPVSDQSKIQTLEGTAFTSPAKTQEMKDKQVEIDKANKDYETALGTISSNPWLSEAGRVGRVKKLYDMYQTEATRLSNEYKDMSDTQANTQNLQLAELNYLSGKKKEDKYLSISESESLGVPYGTTRKEARDMGITIDNTVDNTVKEKTSKTEDEAKRVEGLLTNFGTRNNVSEGYYNQVKAMSGMSTSEFDKRFKYLLGEGAGNVKFSNSDIKRLIASGLTSSDVKNLQKDISKAGWNDNIKKESGLTEEQSTILEDVMNGVSVKDENKAREAKIRPSDNDFQKSAGLLVAQLWKENIFRTRSGERDQAIKDIMQALTDNDNKIDINGKVYVLTTEEINKFRKYMSEVTYPQVLKIRGK